MKSSSLIAAAVLTTAVSSCGKNVEIANAPSAVKGTTMEMGDPEFWISMLPEPDRIIMTPSDIYALNQRNSRDFVPINDYKGDPYTIEETLRFKDQIGIQFNVANPLLIKTFPGDSLRARLEIHKNFLLSSKLVDVLSKEYDNAMKAELIAMTDEGSVPDVVIPRYGLLVEHTLNRVFPTHRAGFNNLYRWLDEFQSTSLDLASPVAVLHASSDGAWYYVRSETAFGWVPARNVALGSPSSIQSYLDAEDILVCLEHKTPVYAGNMSFLTDMYLGAALKLEGKTNEGWRVSVPVRNPDGTIAFVRGFVKSGAVVNEGYQPYTQRNVFNTVFRLLDRPYSWADAENERDCCGTMRVVLRTFGIKTGRWTSHVLQSSDHVTAFPRGTPDKIKYSYLENAEPGITLVGDEGHISMYVGKTDGRYFVIHQDGYDYTEKGTTYLIRRVNVNDTELEGGSNISLWTEITAIK